MGDNKHWHTWEVWVINRLYVFERGVELTISSIEPRTVSEKQCRQTDNNLFGNRQHEMAEFLIYNLTLLPKMKLMKKH